MKKPEMEKLVKKFQESVILDNESLMRGEKTNKYVNASIKAFENIVKKFGDEGREAFSELLKNERPDVRLSAAAFLLRYKHNEALKVLKEVSKFEGLAGFAAQECIKRWNEGAWQLDPADKRIETKKQKTK